MNWKIIVNSKEVSGGLDMILDPHKDVIRFVILQYKIIDLPKLIGQVSKSISTGIEYAHIYNFKDMDWEDLAWAKNVNGTELCDDEMFLVHDVIGETIIKEGFFDKILFDYSSKVLEIYQLDVSLPRTWKDEIKTSLEKLDVKINNKNPMARI